jgi:hypothetical protein
MKFLALAFLLLAEPHCTVSLGVEMPKAEKGLAKLTIYFEPPFERPPVCSVISGEAQFVTVNSGYARLAGKAERRVVFACKERP